MELLNYIKKMDGNSKLIIYAIIILSLLQCIFSFNIVIYISSSILLLLICIYTVKFNIFHPYVWFLPIFTLYQIAYPWLKILNVTVYKNVSFNDSYTCINWFALVALVLLLINIKPIYYDKKNITDQFNCKYIIILLIIIYVLTAFGLIYISFQGFNSKYELAMNKDVFVSITMILLNIISFLSVFICLNKNILNREKIIIFIISTIILLFSVGIIGERDVIINHFIIFLMYYVAVSKISLKKLILLIIALVSFVGFSASLKMFLAKDHVRSSDSGIVVKFLKSDFQSAGYNLNYLMNHQNSWDLRYGRTVIYDVFSVFRNVIDFGDWVSTKWYQNTFWSTRKTGLGFTFLGEGYLNFGVIGIFIWVYIISCIIKYLYMMSNKSIFKFVMYLCFCPMCMYIMRADFANLISPFIKYILLGCFILHFLGYKLDKLPKFSKNNNIVK